MLGKTHGLEGPCYGRGLAAKSHLFKNLWLSLAYTRL